MKQFEGVRAVVFTVAAALELVAVRSLVRTLALGGGVIEYARVAAHQHPVIGSAFVVQLRALADEHLYGQFLKCYCKKEKRTVLPSTHSMLYGDAGYAAGTS